MASANSMHKAGHSKPVLWDNPEEWGEVGGGFRIGGHMCTCVWFISMYSKKPPQYCKVIISNLNKLINLKINPISQIGRLSYKIIKQFSQTLLLVSSEEPGLTSRLPLTGRAWFSLFHLGFEPRSRWADREFSGSNPYECALSFLKTWDFLLESLTESRWWNDFSKSHS